MAFSSQHLEASRGTGTRPVAALGGLSVVSTAGGVSRVTLTPTSEAVMTPRLQSRQNFCPRGGASPACPAPIAPAVSAAQPLSCHPLRSTLP